MVVGMLFVAIALIAGNIDATAETQTRQDAAIYAQHMSAYGGFVALYARSRPTTTGTINDATAGVPGWFVRFPGVTNTIVGGIAYAYVVPQDQAKGFAIARAVPEPFAAGVKVAGRLQPPGGPVGQPLPSTIPDGAVVVVR